MNEFKLNHDCPEKARGERVEAGSPDCRGQMGDEEGDLGQGGSHRVRLQHHQGDDIYIMRRCLFVAKNEPFPLLNRTPEAQGERPARPCRLRPSDNDDNIFFSQIARYISYCGKVYLFRFITFLIFDLFVGTIFVTS